jgi:hypothetical protein
MRSGRKHGAAWVRVSAPGPVGAVVPPVVPSNPGRLTW